MIDKEQYGAYIFLDRAIKYLKLAIASMKEAIGFDQLASGYGPETYEETIKVLIKGIEDYQKREHKIRMKFER